MLAVKSPDAISPAEPEARAQFAAAELSARQPPPGAGESPTQAGTATVPAPGRTAPPRILLDDATDLESLIRPLYLLPVVFFSSRLSDVEIEEAMKEADEAAQRAGRRMGSRAGALGNALPIGAFFADPITAGVRLWVKWSKRKAQAKAKPEAVKPAGAPEPPAPFEPDGAADESEAL